MPAPTPVVGVEFQVCSVANGSGGSVTLFATVLSAAGDFSLRLVNSGTTTGQVRYTRDDGRLFSWDCAAGSRVLIRQQDNTLFARTWVQVAARLAILGGRR